MKIEIRDEEKIIVILALREEVAKVEVRGDFEGVELLEAVIRRIESPQLDDD